ncbi:DUF697 domain-containing protein [Desulfonatronospira sp.]|uniref:YcjF family protein n=1 Tax=Desulfonatronospira sp. TaxID=1962951 RepID=UPI0025B858B6|nr:DUF697 domain-containing protein [Desulfonatronospira sp.]
MNQVSAFGQAGSNNSAQEVEMIESDLFSAINDKVNESLKSRGKVNILIAGKTGVGKSTLINAVFQGNLAQTGQGRPVTTQTREITKEGIPVSIFDTRGLEIAEYKETIGGLAAFIAERNSDTYPMKHVHIAWVCISEGSRRVEDAEIALVSELARFVPIIGVITQAQSDRGFKNEVISIIPQVRNAIRVRALEEQLDSGHVIPVMGLEDLIDLTMDLVPEGQKNAMAAAQKISIKHKKERATKIVAGAAASAATVALSPIPFSDAALLAPIQVGMLAGVSSAFGLPVSKAFLYTLISGSFSAVAGSIGGRALVASAMKFIPGVGTVAGGMIAAGVASTLTTTFGMAYISVLVKLMESNPDRLPSAEEIAASFKSTLKSQAG